WHWTGTRGRSDGPSPCACAWKGNAQGRCAYRPRWIRIKSRDHGWSKKAGAAWMQFERETMAITRLKAYSAEAEINGGLRVVEFSEVEGAYGKGQLTIHSLTLEETYVLLDGMALGHVLGVAPSKGKELEKPPVMPVQAQEAVSAPQETPASRTDDALEEA